MEDIAGYLMNGVNSFTSKRQTGITFSECEVNRNTELKGKEGELTGYFAIHAPYAGNIGCHVSKKYFQEFVKNDEDEMSDALKNAVLKVQTKVYEEWTVYGKRHGVHLCAVVIQNGTVFCVNAGECAAVICRADGIIGMVSDESELSSKRLDEIIEPQVKKYFLDFEDEFILIACNSFWKVFDKTKAVSMARQTLHKFGDVQRTTQKLTFAAQQSGAPSATVIIVLLNAECACAGKDFTNGMNRTSLSIHTPEKSKSQISSSAFYRRSLSYDPLESQPDSPTILQGLKPQKRFSDLFKTQA
mmetsp:Transcript_10344/g.18649  ORF Transcript_10344/g.18649 Transcript_10344/m.18649 type:complete len:301 (+) Transcript_10344:167-1069(+)